MYGGCETLCKDAMWLVMPATKHLNNIWARSYIKLMTNIDVIHTKVANLANNSHLIKREQDKQDISRMLNARCH